MNVIQDDIKPFIPFARDSEGGIASLIKQQMIIEKGILLQMVDLQNFSLI